MSASDAVPDKWDASHIPSLTNKLAIVTGANSGIGYEAALELARKGAHVVLACRHEGRGNEAVTKIEEELKTTPDAGKVEFMQLDVSDQSSVKRFVTEFKKTHDRLDMLINNAGILGIPYTETVDGFEAQMGTNHLGHFTLTAQLFDVLKASPPSRIVNVSSVAHRTALIYDEDKPMISKEKYEPWLAYSNTKLANLLFTMELTRRCEANGVTGVSAIACHPGFATSNLPTAAVQTQSWLMSWVYRIGSSIPIYQTAAMGALPTLYAATGVNAKSGQFIGPNGFRNWWGHPMVEEPYPAAKSASAGRKLWEWSEHVTGVQFLVEK
ncbi:hypothetical protein Poli38472_001107 [Pythium oligandrum]|uniref:Uncharacterized protein n=1 Tax=Pythium oligandrum TaxID=41045 RepID=A0A8K1CUM5_PYTOL|nr:hypothetical protein Poli38472_001107 [Pythium oligandrum]|eukprot:TMW68951.1 hypothetical protein Poli38472_001107 [Pythium oligandrum]